MIKSTAPVIFPVQACDREANTRQPALPVLFATKSEPLILWSSRGSLPRPTPQFNKKHDIGKLHHGHFTCLNNFGSADRWRERLKS
jgi:hypothetical protein